MEKAIVVGKVWATKKRQELEGMPLMIVARSGPSMQQNMLVAVNIVNAKVGDEVIVGFGSGARNALGNQNLPVEAAIIGIVDPEVK
jgi:ethanolamine utilization protein EutN